MQNIKKPKKILGTWFYVEDNTVFRNTCIQNLLDEINEYRDKIKKGDEYESRKRISE